MAPKGTGVFFVLFYAIGWLFSFLSDNSRLFFVMGLFLLIYIATILHPIIYKYGVLRPLQLSLSSVGILGFLNGDSSLFLFTILAVVSFILLEQEDIDSYINYEPSDKDRFSLNIKRIAATAMAPFASTYIVLILRPYEGSISTLIVLIYFSFLFVVAKWFDTIVMFAVFTLVQMTIFVYVIEMYLDWSSANITAFFSCIFAFLFIAYGRKGLFKKNGNIN